MVLPINSDGKNPLSSLLTDVNRQARTVAFNIQFNQMQNTVIKRINSEAEQIANVEGNQRELDALNKTIDDLNERRQSIIKFAFANESNNDRFDDIVSAASLTRTAFLLGDSDVNSVSASEVSNFETNRDALISISDHLVELSHPDFIDGNNVTRLRSQIDELAALTPVEGVIDDAGTDPATNDNRAISDLLDSIISVAGGASDTSTTLQVSSVKIVREIDQKLGEVDSERREITVFRAGEIEYEIQLLRAKYANFLRSVELAFETSSRSTSALTDAMDIQRDPPKGSILSILT